MFHLKRITQLYQKHIHKKKEEPRFLVLLSFLITFLIVRVIAYDINYHIFSFSPFQNIIIHDIHIHHLVFGIILLLIAGFIRIPQVGSTLVRLSSLLYGIGAALTLDEFALWVKFNPEAYFGPEGRVSIDVCIIFILIALSSLWHGIFWKKLFSYVVTSFFLEKKALAYIKKKRKKVFVLCILLGSILLYILYTFVFHIHTQITHATSAEELKIKVSSFPTGMVTPTVVATPSATPTPTIDTHAQLTGFCLQVPVLLYHHIQPLSLAEEKKQTSLSVDNGIFDEQMAYLVQNGYTTITAEQLVTAIHTHSPVPPKSVVVTLDDGYEDAYSYAYPIFQKYHITASLMIPTGLLRSPDGNPDYLTWDELKQMVDSNLVFAYDHTYSHYPLGSGSVEKNQYEIMTGKTQLEQHVGKPVTIFAYPYGSGQQMSWVQDLLEKDGFAGSYSTLPGTFHCESTLQALRRVHIGNAPLSAYGL